MPVHDWTRVGAGTFHHFHSGWITTLSRALNRGLLPASYYALAEQYAGGIEPDVLTLQAVEPDGDGPAGEVPAGGTAVAVAPPRVRFTAETQAYLLKQKSIVIRHTSGDRIVALIEIISPGNKDSQARFQTLINKVTSAIRRGYHLLLIDLQPPTARDPQGIHGAVWSQIGDDRYRKPADKPLTLVSYAVGEYGTKAYIEPIAVGDVLIDMPLFLIPDIYVPVPLEATYMEAWADVPRRWRDVIEPPTA